MQNAVLTLSDYRMDRNLLTTVPIVVPESSKSLISQEHPNSQFYKWLENSGICLNKQQIEVMEYNEGHLVVNALPGSGKTATITALINFLTLVKEVPEHNILALCYSKKASMEMKKRLLRLNPNNCAQVFTLHALSYKILNANGFNKHTLLTDDKIRCGILKSGQEHPISGSFEAEEMLSLNSYHINTMTEILDSEVRKVINDYQSYKTEHKLLDFDDLLTEALHLLQHNTKLLSLLQLRFKYVIIDEFQDLNPLQYTLLKLLCGKGRLYAFGDRNQAIFSFRGSNPQIMAMSSHDFKASEVSMYTSYRCTAQILGLASRLLYTGSEDKDSKMSAVNSGKPVRLIRPQNSLLEAKYIAKQILSEVLSGNRDYKDYAVLYRSAAAASSMMDEFLVRNIPFITNLPLQPLYAGHISKIIIAHLRLAIDRRNVNSLSNLLSSLYLSKVRVMQLINRLPVENNVDLLLLLQQLPDLQDYQQELLVRRRLLLDHLQNITPSKAMKYLFRNEDILKHLHLPGLSLTANKEVVVDITHQLIEDSSQYSSIREYLYHVDTLLEKYRERQQRNSNEDTVSLFSIHGSKGLEFPCIFLINAVEGQIPHQKVLETTTSFSTDILVKAQMSGGLDEERRLLYVAITRAKDELTISAPMNHNDVPSRLSRFLEPFSEHFVPCN